MLWLALRVQLGAPSVPTQSHLYSSGRASKLRRGDKAREQLPAARLNALRAFPFSWQVLCWKQAVLSKEPKGAREQKYLKLCDTQAERRGA